MSALFQRVTVVGVGLLGASLGLALKQRALAETVIGVGRRQASLDVARRRGAVDATTTAAADGVADADLVVIATPAALVPPMLDLVLAHAPAEATIIDVASTKQSICAHANRVCPQPRRFVGCHPMAGGEKFGPENAVPEFYCNSICLVEDDVAVDPAVRERVCALWRGVGARVVSVNAHDHDEMLARTSHAPHVLAAALARAAADFGASPDFIGNGFRDATRIAASRPEIWRDICLDNRAALASSLAALRHSLEEVEALLCAGDGPGLERFFEEGVRARNKATGQ